MISKCSVLTMYWKSPEGHPQDFTKSPTCLIKIILKGSVWSSGEDHYYSIEWNLKEDKHALGQGQPMKHSKTWTTRGKQLLKAG